MNTGTHSLTERHIRAMTFVDGENLCIQGERIAKENGLRLADGKYYRKSTFLCFKEGGSVALRWGFCNIHNLYPILGYHPNEVRGYYYTSYVGTHEQGEYIASQLHSLGYEPKLFKKNRQRERSKGVDISLATDVLSHAFRDNFDIAVIVAGDGDYVPLVEEVKRCGKTVLLQFFACGLNPKLKLAADGFSDVTSTFLKTAPTEP